MSKLTGIHHITAMAGDPQRNLDFYTGVLGLRLVKITVNFDDPGTYHFYYGDGLGRPGTIITFFPWPGAQQGRAGVHQVGLISYAVPQSAVGYWAQRLLEKGVAYKTEQRDGLTRLVFKDPDGIGTELVAMPAAPEASSWPEAPVPADHAIRGFYGAQMWVLRAAPSVKLLETLGYTQVGQSENITHLAPQDGFGFGRVEVRESGQFLAGRGGVGTVHHIAFRVPDEAAQLELRQTLMGAGVPATAVQERQYFRSIYFREPGGVLFEVATDVPGFATDEPFEALGTSLKLPGWLEPHRAQIEGSLPKIRVGEVEVPKAAVGA
ncbi:MAG: ring-cleaving dioxygenase [Meiothermus sp.]|nr:ring-cleaving dioxygenase [Meiothermus sp.]